MSILSITSEESDQQISAEKPDQQISSIYDPAMLQGFIDELCAKARHIVFECMAIYGLLAFAIGFSFGLFAGRQAFQNIPNLDLTSTSLVIGAFAGVVGIILGTVKGRERRFDVKLEAQKLLLQMQIERNTRKGLSGSD